MNKITTFFIFAFVIQTLGFSQSCLPEGITFSTQAEIDNFQTNYPNCTEIEGIVLIYGYDISNLNGLNGITSIGGGLQFIGNPFLTSLSGLNNLISVGAHLTVNYSDTLTNLSGLDNLTSIGGHILITQNKILTSLTGLEGVTTIEDNIDIYQNDALTSLTGLDNVTSIEGGLTIEDNHSLVSLAGLDNVTSIGERLVIIDNDVLTSLTGMDNLISIGGNLSIGGMYSGNPSLTSMTGLDNLTSIGGGFGVMFNSELISLAGLNNLTSIGGLLWIESNNVLISLMGLNNIVATSIDSLYIQSNPSLTTCDVKSVCDYLISPTGTIEIHDNATGCNNQTEVEIACTSSVDEQNINEYISIYPNPVKDNLTISYKNGAEIELVVIYNQIGQKVLEEKLSNNTINVSGLKQGLFVIEMVTGELKIRKKLIIKQ